MKTKIKGDGNYLLISEIAQKVNGTIARGDGKYPVYGMTAVGSAKDFELCMVTNSEEACLANSYDVPVVVTDVEHALCLKDDTIIIVVSDIKEASSILMDAFTKLSEN